MKLFYGTLHLTCIYAVILFLLILPCSVFARSINKIQYLSPIPGAKLVSRESNIIVKYQKDFFDKGQLHLKPLPMSKVAKDVGVHLATVSRAVSGKYIQCSWGILPLRKFFSGGREDVNGTEHSWEAIRGKLQQIIDEEDKAKPLSDDKIREKLAEVGIDNLARRTVAKYHKLMNIPAARFRKKY